MSDPLVSVRDLVVRYNAPSHGQIRALDGVSLDIAQGEILGLAGESGCGKTTLARALLRLVKPASGRISFGLVHTSLADYRRDVQLIFQDARASLNPRMSIGESIGEPLRTLRLARGAEVSSRVVELMQLAGLDPNLRHSYPHELSSGQCQRAAIARALAPQPLFLVADEPVAFLDVSVQAQILNLLRDLQATMGLSLLFISHDLRAVASLANRIAVMYLGQIVELAPASNICNQPLMPYTQMLIQSIPIPDPVRERARRRSIRAPETPPSPVQLDGCPFQPRCPYAIEECSHKRPQLAEIRPGHFAACLRAAEKDPGIVALSAGKV